MHGIPKRLKQVRGRRSQRAFAAEIGVKQQNYSQWERGANVPSLPGLAAVARHECVSLDWLVFGKGQMRGAA